MNDFRTSLIQRQIDRHYPNARLVAYTDADSGLRFYTEQQLQQLTEDWFPLACHIDPDTNALVFGGRGDVSHTYTIGETGSGKTTRFAIQSIRALASMPDKPSFLVTDLHGEIIENLSDHLKANGYTVKILNCDDPGRSDTYNPFATLVKNCQATGLVDDEGHDMLRKISNLMQPVQSNHDPIWEMGARSYTHGCILDKFETLLEHKIPPSCITLHNIIESHYWIRSKLGDNYDIKNIPHFGEKPRTALSVQKLQAVTDNADRTRRSYWGVVENHYDVFGQTTMYRLSSSNTIDVTDFIEKPTAIIVQSGNSVCGDQLVSLMVNDIYTSIVRRGRQLRTKRLPRPIHCFLDEFANCHIADGPAFIKMLTTSRKFGMHWHMMLQSDAQMESKYDLNTSSIIRANCTEIFLGSNDYDTACRFAKSCGKTTIESLSSQVNLQAPILEITELITPEQLNLMEPGWIFVRSRRHPLLHSYFEAFYNCKEYTPPEDIDSIYPFNNFDYRLTSFTPDDISKKITKQEYAILEFLNGRGLIGEVELSALFPPTERRVYIQRLEASGYVTRNGRRIQSNVDPWCFEYFRQQYDSNNLRSHPVPPKPRKSKDDFLVTDCDCNDDFDTIDLLSNIDPEDYPCNMPMDVVLKTPVQPEQAKKITCLPFELLNNIQRVCKGEDPSKVMFVLPKYNFFKYEIIEAFVARNDFDTKEEWVETLREEVRIITENNWFDEQVTVCFTQALEEVADGLTLSHIQEIKSLLSDD